MAGGGIAALGAVLAGGAAVGAGFVGFAYMLSQIGRTIVHGRAETVVARIRTDSAGLVHVRRRHLAETSLATADDGSLAIDLRFKNGRHRFTGREAERIASIVVPKVNRFGGSKAEVASAVREIESLGSSEGFLEHLGGISHVYTRPLNTLGVPRWRRGGRRSQFNKWGLFALPAPYRLALEMSLHEESERRALEGELAELERAWQDAEEVAAISDDLLVPESVEAAMRRLKGKR